MTIHQVRRLIRLNQEAQQHANEFKRLSKDPNAQSIPIWHLGKSERLYSQVLKLIRDCA